MTLKNPERKFHAIFVILWIAFAASVVWTLVLPFAVIASLVTTPKLRPLRAWAQTLTGQALDTGLTSICFVLQTVGGVQFYNYGNLDTINKNERALLISNHSCLFDWMYLWTFLYQYSQLHHFRIVLKKDVQSVPWFGWVCQIAMFVFLTRDWANDKERIMDILSYYREYCDYYTLLIFPEGTNLGPHSEPKSTKYITDNGYKPLYETLIPRTTGFVNIILKSSGLDELYAQTKNNKKSGDDDNGIDINKQCTRDEIIKQVKLHSRFDAVYNITLAYNPSRDTSQLDLVKFRLPLGCHTHCQRIPIEDLFIQSLDIDPLCDKTYLVDKSKQISVVPSTPSIPSNNSDDNSSSDISSSTVSPSIRPVNINTTNNMNAITYNNLETKIAIWLTSLWYEKDAMLHKFYQSNPTDLMNPRVPPLLDQDTYVPETTPPFMIGLVRMIMTSLVLSSLFILLIFNPIHLRWCILLYTGLSIYILSIKSFNLYDLILSTNKTLHNAIINENNTNNSTSSTSSTTIFAPINIPNIQLMPFVTFVIVVGTMYLKMMSA